MGLFDRWLIPYQQTAMLQTRLNEATAQANWFDRMARDAGAKLLKKEAELAAEIKRNRKREDDLMNQIIELSGGRKVSTRIEPPTPEPEPVNKLTAVQESILRERAREYCEQKSHGEPVTQEQFEEVYQRMLEDPAQWLND